MIINKTKNRNNNEILNLLTRNVKRDKLIFFLNDKLPKLKYILK